MGLGIDGRSDPVAGIKGIGGAVATGVGLGGQHVAGAVDIGPAAAIRGADTGEQTVCVVERVHGAQWVGNRAQFSVSIVSQQDASGVGVGYAGQFAAGVDKVGAVAVSVRQGSDAAA